MYLLLSLVTIIMYMTTHGLFIKILSVVGICYVLLLINSYYDKKHLMLSILVCVLIVCMWDWLYERQHIGKTYRLKGETVLIINEMDSEDSTTFVAETTGAFKQRYLLVFTKERPQQLLGRYVALSGKIEPIERVQNKYLFNYQKYTYSVGQFHQLFNPQYKFVEKRSFKQLIYRCKDRVRQYITTKFEPGTQMFLRAMLLRDQRDLKEKYAHLVEMGVLQIFAVSVMYMKRIQWLCRRLSRYLRLPKVVEGVIISILLYFTSMWFWQSVSLQQLAVSCILYYMNTLLLNNKIDKVSLISLSGLLFVIINPYVVFNIGFIFIFLLRFGFLFSLQHLTKRRGYEKYVIFPLFIFFIMIPVMLYSQQQIAIGQVIFYLIVAPFNFIFLLLSFFVLFVPWVEGVFQHILMCTIAIYEWCAPFYAILSMNLSWLFWTQSICIYGLYFWFLQSKRWQEQVRKAFVICCLITMTHYINVNLDSVHFLSLPYGEVTIIKAQGVNYLIDVGGNNKEKDNIYQTEAIIVPFLQRLYIDRVHHLILTHDDADHVGAFEFFIANFIVDNVYYNDSSLPFAHLVSKNPAVQYHQVSDLREIGELKVFPIYRKGDHASTNNLSLVTYAVFGGKRWLFMGDLEHEGEHKMLQQYPHLQVDVLKIGHHGSKTSSSSLFLRALKPAYAIITVQKRNRHRHPHNEVIKRLESYNITYYNTNEVGSIHFFWWKEIGTFVIE